MDSRSYKRIKILQVNGFFYIKEKKKIEGKLYYRGCVRRPREGRSPRMSTVAIKEGGGGGGGV